MAPVPIIDLTSSPEPDESPNKVASAALAQFQPSKERINRNVGHLREQRSFSGTGLNHQPAVVSHRKESVGGYHPAQVRSALPHHRPQVNRGKSARSEWHSVANTQRTTVNARSNADHQKSLTTLLQEEAKRSAIASQRPFANFPRNPASIVKIETPCIKANVSSAQSNWASANVNMRPSNKVSPFVGPPATPPASLLQKTQPVAVTSKQPLVETKLKADPLDLALSPLKRPAPSTQDEPAATPSKRHQGLLEKTQEKLPLALGGQRPASSHQSWLVDVTDSTLEEHATFSDDAHNWNVSRVVNDAGTSARAQPQSRPPTQSLLDVRDTKLRTNNHGTPYSAEEDDLLKRLKDVDRLSWDEIVPFFNGRTRGSLQVRYSNKLASKPAIAHRMSKRVLGSEEVADMSKSQSPDPTSRPKRSRKPVVAAVDGMISWTEVLSAQKTTRAIVDQDHEEVAPSDPLSKQDRALPSSMARLLRQRELGRGGGRAWLSGTKSVTDELNEHVFSSYGLSHYHHGTSGDVLSVSWSPDGRRFAAGSAAISDNTSMQYNMSRNLLIGDAEQKELRELVEHHEPRPIISDSKNINALHAMRESQDPRLFVTVTATSFSRDGEKLYSAGKDRKLRVYAANKPLNKVECRYEIDHPAAVDLLSVNDDGLVATGCHVPNKGINVYHCTDDGFGHRASLSPPQGDHIGASLPLYPSALKWGAAPQHRGLLLAGFCPDSNVQDDSHAAGATCIWDVQNLQQIPIKGVTSDVSDVAWNPLPSPTSVVFAVASGPSGISVNKGVRSVIQCFAPNQDALRRVLLWQCPALDINDVIFCPHDANLVACGATDGKVYVWDQRFADRSQKPLHILEHGESLTVLPDVDRELIDTGVRFLSWGASKSRLYSGSSDGIVKVWNPYRSTGNAEVMDFTTPRHQRSAIMAGAFSSDSRKLLIGTEVGQINLFSIEQQGHGQPAKRLKMHTSPASPEPRIEPLEPRTEHLEEAKALLASGKIEFRPCGALPVRQAVQGPNYDGPYAASANEIQQARDAYQLALDAQYELHLDANSDATDLEKATVAVKNALAALTDQEDRLQFHQSCQPKAWAFQRKLLAAEVERSLLELSLPYREEPCTLHGERFNLDIAAENAADSGDSELRIPGFLALTQRSTTDVDAREDEIGAESVSSTVCPTCFPFSRSRKKRMRCQKCVLKLAGLTSTCAKCSAPARTSTSATEPSVCAKCSFACFRCGRLAVVSPETKSIHCDACGLTWEAGVLGYELLPSPQSSKLATKVSRLNDNDEDDELENVENEHYASLWEAQIPHKEDETSMHFAMR